MLGAGRPVKLCRDVMSDQAVSGRDARISGEWRWGASQGQGLAFADGHLAVAAVEMEGKALAVIY